MNYLKITKQEIDDKLKATKGWKCSIAGNEYIYDFHLKKYPIIVKVASSISINTDKAKNKGSDVIRIFAVQKEGIDKESKILNGLIKARIVYRTIHWKEDIEKQIFSVINSSKVVYDKYRRNK